MTKINERMKAWAITQEELDLRWQYAQGEISLSEFNKRFAQLKKENKIKRNGRTVK